MPSNGSLWYGGSIGFPGFLYKKNTGVGTRRSTKMAAGGNTTCNGPTYIYNKYKPGGGGVGASSIANRRAKNRLATVCEGTNNKCFPCYNTLGQYSSYTANPNGFVPCPPNLYNFTPTPSPTAPSAPMLYQLIATNENLILNFTLGSDGGSAITDIEYSTNNGVTWVSSGETSSPFAVTGLTNGTTYQVAVRAKNVAGTSASSNVIPGTPNPVTNSYTAVETTTWTAPPGVTSVEYLVVGGGGGSGGGFDNAGGGGSGGGMVKAGTLSVTPGTSYTITVGDGGIGGISIRSPVSETNGSVGDNSIFASITALGGGGGYASRLPLGGPARAGGSQVSGPTASTGGNGGFGGGGGGGGGGNASNGSNGVTTTGGSGGSGISNSISGSSVTYGAGGSGANSGVLNAAVVGAANTGDGARGGGTGGSAQTNGAKGGSGIVIIKF
jgi:hypothetical protein